MAVDGDNLCHLSTATCLGDLAAAVRHALHRLIAARAVVPPAGVFGRHSGIWHFPPAPESQSGDWPLDAHPASAGDFAVLPDGYRAVYPRQRPPLVLPAAQWLAATFAGRFGLSECLSPCPKKCLASTLVATAWRGL